VHLHDPARRTFVYPSAYSSSSAPLARRSLFPTGQHLQIERSFRRANSSNCDHLPMVTSCLGQQPNWPLSATLSLARVAALLAKWPSRASCLQLNMNHLFLFLGQLLPLEVSLYLLLTSIRSSQISLILAPSKRPLNWPLSPNAHPMQRLFMLFHGFSAHKVATTRLECEIWQLDAARSRLSLPLQASQLVGKLNARSPKRNSERLEAGELNY